MKLIAEAEEKEALPEEDDDDVNVRRSRRRAIPPLQWWKGDSVIYERTSKGNSPADALTASVCVRCRCFNALYTHHCEHV